MKFALVQKGRPTVPLESKHWAGHHGASPLRSACRTGKLALVNHGKPSGKLLHKSTIIFVIAIPPFVIGIYTLNQLLHKFLW